MVEYQPEGVVGNEKCKISVTILSRPEDLILLFLRKKKTGQS